LKTSILIKRIGLFVSAIALIQLSMPISPNGRIIGIVFSLLAFLAVIKIPAQGLPSKKDINFRIFLLSIIIAVYGFLNHFYMLRGYNVNISLFEKLHLNSLIAICTVEFLLSLYAIMTFFHCCKANIRLNFRNVDANSFYRFSVAYGFACLIFMLVFCFNKETWFDENFSMAMIKHSFSEVISLTGRDVHPPLYYLILKCFVDICHTIIPSVSLVVWGKICSVFTYAIAYITMTVYVKKQFGKKVSGLSIICLFGMANMMEYGLEIRMYSWTMLFIFIAYLYMYRILEHNGKLYADCIGFSMFSLLSAYTHYYAGLVAAVLFLYLFIESIRGMKCWKTWIWTAALTGAAYLPWIRVLFVSLASVTSRSWPDSINLETVISYFRLVFGYYSTFLIVLAVIVFYFLQEKKMGEHNVCLWTGFLCPFLVMGIGVVISILYAPVLTDRYLFAALGCMWTAVAYMTVNSKNLNLQNITVKAILIFAFVNLFVFAKNQMIEIPQINKFYDEINEFADQGMLATNVPEIAYDAAICCEKHVYLFEGGNGVLMRDVFSPQITETNIDLNGFLNAYGEDICLLVREDKSPEVETILSQTENRYAVDYSLSSPYGIVAYKICWNY